MVMLTSEGNDIWSKQSPDPARWRRRVANGKSFTAIWARRKPEAKTRADEQVCPASEAVEGRQMRRGKTGTSLQHKMKSSIHRIVEPRRSDSGASKAVGLTPGEPLCLLSLRSEQPARGTYRIGAVSRGHSSRRKRAGSSRRRETRPTKNPEDSPRQRPERCLCRRARVNESGK